MTLLSCVLVLGCGGATSSADSAQPAPTFEETPATENESAPQQAQAPALAQAPGNALREADSQQPRVASEARTALREALMRRAADISVAQRSDGITQLRVERGWRSASVLVRGQDGKLQHSCVDSAEQLDRMLEAQP